MIGRFLENVKHSHDEAPGGHGSDPQAGRLRGFKPELQAYRAFLFIGVWPGLIQGLWEKDSHRGQRMSRDTIINANCI